jgi:DNA-binding NarL/FixJ family response regulator
MVPNKSSETAPTVWIVDDKVFTSQAYQLELNDDGRVHCDQIFSSWPLAREALNSDLQRPDVILLDLDMPEVDGLSALRDLRSFDKAIKVLMFTVDPQQENVAASLDLGANGYLHKDSDLEELVGSILYVQQGGMPITRALLLDTFLKKKTPHSVLSRRESEIMDLLTIGKTMKVVAKKLCISYDTVTTHVRNIYSKLEVHNKAEAINRLTRK